MRHHYDEEKAIVTPPFIFMDLRTADLGVSRHFYTELFGWTVADMPAGPATIPMFVDAGGPWGGITQLAEDDERRPQRRLLVGGLRKSGQQLPSIA